MQAHLSRIVMLFLCLLWMLLQAQGQHTHAGNRQLPIRISVFSESFGLPSSGRFFKQSGLGIRVGTELYYTNKSGSQFYQTIQLGFYNHRKFASAFFVSSEAGYRKYVGQFFADATLGAGLQYNRLAQPVYRPVPGGFAKTPGNLLRITPVLGVGTGYAFPKTQVFARYELLGEMPFGYKGIPALPHQTFHLGTQFRL